MNASFQFRSDEQFYVTSPSATDVSKSEEARADEAKAICNLTLKHLFLQRAALTDLPQDTATTGPKLHFRVIFCDRQKAWIATFTYSCENEIR